MPLGRPQVSRQLRRPAVANVAPSGDRPRQSDRRQQNNIVNSLTRYFITLRRFLAACGLAVWLGGFTFYGAVVIPMGEQVLGSHRPVGFITQQVSEWLNLIGVVALVFLVANLADEWRGLSGWRKLGLAGTWLIMALGLVTLFALHPSLDAVLERESQEIVNYERFIWLHRSYLAISTLQWAAGLLHAWCLLLPALSPSVPSKEALA